MKTQQQNLPRGTTKIKLPFQYTDEGRAQLEAKRDLVAKARQDLVLKTPLRVSQSTLALAYGAAGLSLDETLAVMGRDIETNVAKSMQEAELRTLASWMGTATDYGRSSATRTVTGPPMEEREVPNDGQFTDSHASYLSQIFTHPERVISDATVALANVDYDTIIGTGVSGALAVQLLARALGKHYAIVRKPKDGTHSMNAIEGRVGRRWVFVDDLIASGTTARRVIDSIKQHSELYGWATKRVGSYLYEDRRFYPAGNYPGFSDYGL